MKFLFLLLIFPTLSQAVIRTELLPYKKGDVPMEGVIAYDDATTNARPGVIVFSDWMGRKYAEKKIADLAALGYVALAADVYGRNFKPKDQKEAAETANRFKADRKLMRERALSAMEALARDKRVNPKMIAAIGYCFGGTVALELAREGAPLRGAVSFHGNLESQEEIHHLTARILVLHGASDPYVKPQEIAEFQRQMTEVKADWQMNTYAHAVHSFTNKEAGKNPSTGNAYNRLADERSWKAMKEFLSDVFHL